MSSTTVSLLDHKLVMAPFADCYSKMTHAVALLVWNAARELNLTFL